MFNDSKKIRPELLAPAGNMEKLKTALAFGADAVYVGIPDFSLRARINDFDLLKLKQAIEYCHARDKKLYVTANIFAHNRHLSVLAAFIRKLKKIGPDAIILSDLGVLMIVRQEWPEAEIHLSTQANCTNWQAAKFWQEQGVSRVVLGREVTLAEIKQIKKKLPDLELEYFVHGAMCMSYSGRCFLSKMYVGRSANLGDCVQPCRWQFRTHLLMTEGHEEQLELVEEEHGSYLLNSKDLCLIEHLGELYRAGVTSFKIEGRAKSVYYQAVVNAAYRQAIDVIGKRDGAHLLAELRQELETKLMHRGYTSGFLFSDKADENTGQSHIKCGWEFCGQVQAPLARAKDLILVKVHNTLKLGDIIEIVRPGDKVLVHELKKMEDARTGESISEAHGGQDFQVLIPVAGQVPEYSVLRRQINN